MNEFGKRRELFCHLVFMNVGAKGDGCTKRKKRDEEEENGDRSIEKEEKNRKDKHKKLIT